jgi:hypothetical protein
VLEAGSPHVDEVVVVFPRVFRDGEAIHESALGGTGDRGGRHEPSC